MVPISYDTARMNAEERIHRAELRRLTRDARIEARARRPRSSGLSQGLRLMARTALRLAPWKLVGHHTPQTAGPQPHLATHPGTPFVAGCVPR
jgi:hypothetical protein